MAEAKITGPTKFVWYELMTPDAKASEAFYTGVVGWTASQQPGGKPDMPYTLLHVGDAHVGGLLQMPAAHFTGTGKHGEGPVPHWIGYIGVDDVEDAASKVKAAGGQIYKAPEDIAGVGRFSVVADPQRNPFVLFQPMNVTTPPPQLPASTPGVVGWHELHSSDGGASWEFYSSMFGWTKTSVMDMGKMGIYQMFAFGDEVPVGGMMTAANENARPGWLFYVSVADIDVAAGRINELGGKVLMGPHEVPGGSWIIQGKDPLGATFALAGPRKQ